MKPARSLLFTLTLWYTVILGAIVILSGLFLYHTFRNNRMEALDRTLKQVVVDLRETWLRSRTLGWNEVIRAVRDRNQNHQPQVMVIHYPDPHEADLHERPTVFTSAPGLEGSFLLADEIYDRVQRSPRDEPTYITQVLAGGPSHGFRLILFPMRGNYMIQVGISLEQLADNLRQLFLIMLMAGASLLVLASVGGGYLIRRALKPVKNILRAAQSISAFDLSLRIPADGRSDEIGELVATFNGMIARLEQSVQRIRQFTGDVSHELRTPLTIIRGEIEIALRKERDKREYTEILRSLLDETGHLEAIINDLLFLSKLEEQVKPRPEQRVMLDEILLEVFEKRLHTARVKQLTFSLGEVQRAEIPGDAVLLERLIGNLVDNAIRYSPAGASVVVSLIRSGEEIMLAVRDTGIGIPLASRQFLFDRFYVVDKSRSRETGGAGLGLAIAKQVADFHQARIDVESTPGQGSTFTVRFPAG